MLARRLLCVNNPALRTMIDRDVFKGCIMIAPGRYNSAFHWCLTRPVPVLDDL